MLKKTLLNQVHIKIDQKYDVHKLLKHNNFL